METLKAITAARAALILDQPFFGALALRLRVKIDDTCPTAYTDGTVLGFNPEFVDGLTARELQGLVAHEVLHCACAHPYRKGNRDHKKFNIAADYAINGELLRAGFELPSGALFSEEYDGKSAEWIYDRLPASEDNKDGDGDGQPGEVRSPESGAEQGDGEQLSEADWMEATNQAAAVAAGSMGGSLARFADKATKPPVDWRGILARFVQDTAAADYSWQRPNKRYFSSGIYMPSLYSQAMGHVVIGVDTSGSIDQTALSQFQTEIRAIFAEVQPSRVDVLYCDTEITKRESFGQGEQVTIEATGGGGTAFSPVFEAVEDTPACLIYLTDLGLYGEEWPQEQEYPVLWATYGTTATAPMGETVPIG